MKEPRAGVSVLKHFSTLNICSASLYGGDHIKRKPANYWDHSGLRLSSNLTGCTWARPGRAVSGVCQPGPGHQIAGGPSQPVVTGERFQQGDRKRKGGEAGGEHSGPGTPPPIIAVAIDSQEEKRKWAGVIIREASSNQREGCFENRIHHTTSVSSIRSSIVQEVEHM